MKLNCDLLNCCLDYGWPSERLDYISSIFLVIRFLVFAGRQRGHCLLPPHSLRRSRSLGGCRPNSLYLLNGCFVLGMAVARLLALYRALWVVVIPKLTRWVDYIEEKQRGAGHFPSDPHLFYFRRSVRIEDRQY